MPSPCKSIDGSQERLKKGRNRRQWRVRFPEAPRCVSYFGVVERNVLAMAAQESISDLVEVPFRARLATSGPGHCRRHHGYLRVFWQLNLQPRIPAQTGQ